MRLLHFLPAAFAATRAFALDMDNVDEQQQLVKRISSFAELMVKDLNNLTAVTQNITATIMNFTDLNGALVIQSSTNVLFEALNISTADANSAGDATLSATDAQALGPPTQFLAYAANHSIAALIGKKPLFAELGLASLVVTSLEQQINASNAFSSVLLSKIPPGLLPVSSALNSQVVDSLTMGLDCFEGKNESCNATPVNSSRTIQAAQDSGAIPKGAAGRAREVSGLLAIGAAVVAGVVFAA